MKARNAVAVLAVGGQLIAARHWLRNWGATPGEITQRLPGDDLVADPVEQTTRAVTVEAPAKEVWQWLIQTGQDRGGMYSYDWLENLIGLRIHSTDRILPEWQTLSPGDRVRLVRPGWLGLKTGVALPVVRVVPGQSIVLREEPPEFPWDAIWSFHVARISPTRSRLISRGREHRVPGVKGFLMRSANQLMDPITLLMTRKMLLGIKERAEANRAGLPSRTPSEVSK